MDFSEIFVWPNTAPWIVRYLYKAVCLAVKFGRLNTYACLGVSAGDFLRTMTTLFVYLASIFRLDNKIKLKKSQNSAAIDITSEATADVLVPSTPLYVVKNSTIHGTGIFARSTIAPGECIVEYQGERIQWDEAQNRADAEGPLNHTYFFSLNDGRIIDGGSGGNEARFINHSCEPNCEAIEHDDGRVYIYSVLEIAAGEELSYDYALIFEERHTPAVKRAFACYCGAPGCSGSMLMPKRSARYRAQKALSK